MLVYQMFRVDACISPFQRHERYNGDSLCSCNSWMDVDVY